MSLGEEIRSKLFRLFVFFSCCWLELLLLLLWVVFCREGGEFSELGLLLCTLRCVEARDAILRRTDYGDTGCLRDSARDLRALYPRRRLAYRPRLRRPWSEEEGILNITWQACSAWSRAPGVGEFDARASA